MDGEEDGKEHLFFALFSLRINNLLLMSILTTNLLLTLKPGSNAVLHMSRTQFN